ncbi:MAG: ATP-binding protein [Methanomassiliicoccales archaeon]|jgi:PAS domain S-box-containing protein
MSSKKGIAIDQEKLRSENKDLEAKIKALQEELEKTTQTLEAIRRGEVDAIKVSAKNGDQNFTIKGAEDPYRTFFEQMNEGAVEISHDGGILYSNRRFADSMRTHPEKVIGKNLDTYIHLSKRKAFRSLLEKSVNGPVRGDILFEAEDGTQVPMQLSVSYFPPSDKPTYSVVITDLSERIQSEDALKKANEELEMKVQERTKDLTESEARYRSLFENILETVTLRQLVFDEKGDVVDSILIDANSAALRSWGFSSIGDVRGKSLGKLFSPDVAAMHLKNVREAMSLGKPLRVEENFNGRNYLSTFVPLGKDHIIVSSADITPIKIAQKETEEYAEMLKRSNTELQQFVYVASHDLQEPLRMVISYLTLLERRQKDRLDGEALEYIQYAVDGGKRMKELIDDLLEFSRIDIHGKHFDLVDMNTVVGRTIDILKIHIEENRAEIDIDPLPSVLADESQLVQVIQNLISNAIKFHGEEPPRIHVSATSGSGEWIFSVKDNGIGLNMEYTDRIFQMFQRLYTRDEVAGTGIGLAIAKKIVERHGGRIWVESEEGKGATFFFTIPKNI